MTRPIFPRLVELDEKVAAVAPGMHLNVPVGIYVGLLLGLQVPEIGRELRQQIERELGEALGVPAEAVESDFRSFLEALTS